MIITVNWRVTQCEEGVTRNFFKDLCNISKSKGILFLSYYRKIPLDLSFTEPKLTYVRRGVQEEVSCILGLALNI